MDPARFLKTEIPGNSVSLSLLQAFRGRARNMNPCRLEALSDGRARSAEQARVSRQKQFAPQAGQEARRYRSGCHRRMPDDRSEYARCRTCPDLETPRGRG